MSPQPVVDSYTNEPQWAEQLCVWLAELGSTADAIAASLAERGHTGQRGKADACPVANYVRARFGAAAEHLDVDVDVRVEVSDGPRFAAVAYEPLAEFIERFDDGGEWPELVEGGASS